jgi:predicted membrane protein
MWNRVAILLRARFAARGAAETVPIAALFLHASVAAFLCGVVRDSVTPYMYAAFALTISSGLVALPLLGEFGALLVHDEADAWVRALPISDLEQRLARALHVLAAALTQSASSLVVAAVLAPSSFGAWARFELVAQGLALATTIAAVLVWLQSLFATRAPALLVTLQTLLFGSVIVGAVVGVRFVGSFGALESPSSPIAFAFPPTLFAATFARDVAFGWPVLGWGLASAGLLSLLVLPNAGVEAPRSARHWSSMLFAPLHALAVRAWVRRDERAAFELVFDALPREREFVMRSYPLVGVPLAFLALGARGEPGTARDGLAALLLFTSATYLPVLLAQVTISRSHRARWLLDTAPAPRSAIANGAFKALVVRFVVPLYVLLSALALAQSNLEQSLRLVPLSFLVAVTVTRQTWPFCVHDVPLSNAPEHVGAKLNWNNLLGSLGVILTLLAVLAWRFVDRTWIALAACVVLVFLERATDRAWRAPPRTN